MSGSTHQLDRLAAAIDPGRVHAGAAIGLRDLALVSLLGCGLRMSEVCVLVCQDVEQVGSEGRLQIRVSRGPWRCEQLLPVHASARLLAWIEECRSWRSALPGFAGRTGAPLSRKTVSSILLRYSRRGGRLSARSRG